MRTAQANAIKALDVAKASGMWEGDDVLKEYADAICSKSDGMFLYARFVLDGLVERGKLPASANTVGRTTCTKVTKLATGLPGRPISGVPPMMPIATGRPGLIAMRHSTSVPMLSTAALT